MNIRQGDIGLLLALDALLKFESVSLAADHIGISQPAMSSQLKRLRSLFNDPLLTPSGRRLVATSQALSLQAELRRHLQGLDALVRERNRFVPFTTEQTFRVIGTDYVHSVLASSLEAFFGREAPSARLAFLPFAPRTLWSALENDSTDLALVTGMNLPDAKVLPVLTEGFRVIQRKGHPRGMKPITLDEYCAARHVLVSPEGGGFDGLADQILASQNMRRQVAVSSPGFLLAPQLVSQSDSLCLIPSRIASLYSELVDSFAPPFETPTFDVEMLWHPRRQNDPSHQWFREAVRSLSRKRAA